MFKQVFYYHILPELKARNKVVVVISHDDRFFNLADTLMVMEEGKLIRTERLCSELREPLALESDVVA